MEISEIYLRLKEYHGSPGGQWTAWCKRPKTDKERELVLVESVLTQRANWNNVELAVKNLRKESMEGLKDLLCCEEERLQGLIKPSGFFRIKTERLKNLAQYIVVQCKGIGGARKKKTAALRAELLELKGIGEETADSILLYAFERPVFVIDEYTRRLAQSLNLSEELSYGKLKTLFEKQLAGADYKIYQDFHALIVIEGKKPQWRI